MRRTPWGPVTGPITPGSLTDDPKPVLTGTAEAGSTVKLYDNTGTLIAQTTADSHGNWSAQPTAPLSDGAHSLTATATDAAGNVSHPCAALPFAVDTHAPTTAPTISDVEDNVAPVIGPVSNGGTTNDTTPTISGRGAEANGTVNIYDGTSLSLAASLPIQTATGLRRIHRCYQGKARTKSAQPMRMPLAA